MKKIGFIGEFDKIDMVIYLAKILTLLNKKVLIVDGTTNQKTRYILPTITNEQCFVTEFEGIDIAIGFQNFDTIAKYLNQFPEKIDYDYVFIDANTKKGCDNFDLKTSTINYFVSSFDIYSLKKGLEIFEGVDEVQELTKVMFSRDVLREDDDYLNFLSLQYKIVWNERRFNFPYDNGDFSVISENQRLSKIKFKKLSQFYKDSLSDLISDIANEESQTNIRRVIKYIEKGV